MMRKSQPVHAQIARRIILIISAAFAAFALIGSVYLAATTATALAQTHDQALTERADQIAGRLQRIIQSAEALAGSRDVRAFADAVAAGGLDPVGSGGETVPGQQAALEALAQFVQSDTRHHLLARYVDRRGSIWVEVINAGGVIARRPQPQPGALVDDASLLNALSGHSGTLSSITPRPTANGLIPVLRAFAPVISLHEDMWGNDRDKDDDILGVIELDVSAAPVLNLVGQSASRSDLRWVLVSQSGHYLADSRNPDLSPISAEAELMLAAREPQLDQILRDHPGALAQHSLGDELLSAQPIQVGFAPDMPWRLLVIDSSGVSVAGGVVRIIGLLLATAAGWALTTAGIRRVLRRRLEPLETVQTVVEQLARGGVNDTPMPVRAADDMGRLLEALAQVSARLNDLTVNAEEQLKRHRRNLERAARISQEVAALDDMHSVINRMIDRICDEFGCSHAQVFVLDDIQQRAVLMYSHGAIGQRLLAQKHALPVNGESLVGQAARLGRALVANDLHRSPAADPAIPARTQMALPLVSGGQTLGVLDVYSPAAHAFESDEQRTFQLLADQMAIALYNARMLTRAQARLHQMETLNRQLTRGAWEEFTQSIHLPNAFQYDLMSIEPLAEADAPPSPPADSLSATIAIRGETIGEIRVISEPGQPFTQSDQSLLHAVVERVGLVIESARLFKETQSSLAVTSTLYQLSRYLNEANTLEDVVRAIIDASLYDAAGGQIWLFDDYPPSTLPQWAQVAADWTSDARAGGRAGLRLYVPDSHFLSTLQPDRVKVVQDVAFDQRLDGHLQQMLLGWGTRAAVFIPINVRGVWRGLITLEFDHPREFSEAEGRVYTSLIDQAGVAIDNRLLVKQTEMALDQIERLYAASRIINSAQTIADLVSAAGAAAKDPRLSFEMGLLEGALDATGWPTQVRRVSRYALGQLTELDEVEPLTISPISPLRQREPQITAGPAGVTAMFPMFSDNVPVAILYLMCSDVDELSDQDVEIYQALTGQMSTVLENQRLLDRTAQALDETRRLYAASRAITSAPDLKAVYQAASQHLAESAPQVNRVTVLLAGPDPTPNALYYDYVHVWELEHYVDTPVRPGTRVSAEAAPFGSVLGTAPEPVYFANLTSDSDRYPRLSQLLARGGAVSALVTPIRSQRSWFGVLICESTWTDGFDEAYQRFARAVADQVAIAVENRLLFEEARQEAQRALALVEVGQLASRIGSEFEQSLEEVFARVAQAANYDRWQLMLLDEAQPDRLLPVIQRLPSEDGAPPLDLTAGQHSIADAVRLRRSFTINSPGSYPAFVGYDDAALKCVGKHIVTPILIGDQVVGALAVGRGLDSPDLGETDEQLIATLAAQIAVAIENRRLFRAAESEREYLRSILETMPTGILVLDARTLKPIRANAQLEALLGQPVDYDQPFSAERYNLYRAGTAAHYLPQELPLMVAAAGQHDFCDDAMVILPGGTHIDLLVNAAPIRDGQGNVVAVVASFQDISNLRSLESALQENLRETIALYEATRSLAEAGEVEAVLDIVVTQLMMLEPTDGYVALLDEITGALQVVRAIGPVDGFDLPDEVFTSGLLFIPDVDQHPDAELGARLTSRGIGALASAPLRARDTVLGWIVVVYDHPRTFSMDNERFLTTLADGAAVAIDNRNLFNRTEQAYQEATVLYRAGRALANASTPEDVVRAAVEHLDQPHVEQIFLAVPVEHDRDGQPKALEVVASWQRPGLELADLRGARLTAERFPPWSLLLAPGLRAMDDVTADPALDGEARAGLAALNIRSLAVIPLRAGERLLGVLWLGSSETLTHTDRDQRIYQAFAEQAALSMEATRLLRQTERRARQLATSAQVSQIASSILDLDSLLPRLVNLIRDAFGYDHVQIFLMDERDEYAELRASTGEAGQKLLAAHHRLAKGSASVIGQVTATGKPTLALDTADARVIHRPNPLLPDTRSEMALPLILKNRVVGALDVQSNQPYFFTDEDVAVLSGLAAQIAVAIDNATLFAQAERRARDMSFLFTITAAAARPGQTLTDSLHHVAELILNEQRALAVAIYLVEAGVDRAGQPYQRLRSAALTGLAQPMSELSEIVVGDPDHLLGVAADRLEPVIIPDIAQEMRYLPIAPEAQSAVLVPMASGSQLVGMIALESGQLNAFSADTLTLLRTLTSTLAAIVQNAQLLDQVQKTNEQLRELDRLKSEFLANMSHELRTPLNSIIGFSRVILKGIDGPLTEMQEQDLTTIYNSGQHLLGLINDILDQAKISSGRMDLQYAYFDIRQVIEGVRSIGIGLVKDKPIDIRLDLASGLPPCYGDEFRTRQVLLNLVSNAAKFTLEGSITIRAYLEHDQQTDRDMMRVDVIDTGIGIAEKDLPLLFEAFRQVDSSLTRTAGGTGLGLPISKSLVEMQGGRMLVRSQVNVGSTFSVLIPLEPVGAQPAADDVLDTAELAAQPAETNGSRSAGEDVRDTIETMAVALPAAKRQILLIEDSPEMVDMFRRTLQREGFDIFSASIPLEAEAMGGGLHPTLIIMDVDFAGGAGWDILRRLRERDDTCDIPVIVVTLSPERERALQAGAFAFLSRPFLPEQLIELVHQAERESQTERILIIDDQPESARLLQDLLAQDGRYRVFTARSGTEGVSMVARRRPDLILLDLRMPGMDGLAVLEELRGFPETAGIPIVVVTADTLSAEEQARLAGVRVISKSELNDGVHPRLLDHLKGRLN